MTNVLILDEHNVVANLLREELATDGHEVTVCTNPLRWDLSLFVLRADMAIVDPFLGGHWRWDLLEQIIWAQHHVPIIVYTGHEACAQDNAVNLADAFVLKKSSLEEIRKTVGEVKHHTGRSTDAEHTSEHPGGRKNGRTPALEPQSTYSVPAKEPFRAGSAGRSTKTAKNRFPKTSGGEP